MAVDKNGHLLHVGDKVLDSKGEKHVINGMATNGEVIKIKIDHAKFVDFAKDVTLVEKHDKSAPVLAAAAASQDQSIVWGNGN